MLKAMSKIEDFGIDPKVDIGTEWHALAEFYLSAPYGLLRFFGSRINSDRIYLLVSSPGLTMKPSDTYISNELFSKRLTMDSFDEKKIREYVDEKVGRAIAEGNNLPAVLTYLSEYFVIDE